MNPVLDAFRKLIPLQHRTKTSGWTNFNCPACGDQDKRGGLLETESGGFRYKCFNGGCEYENRTGWEPGYPVRGRIRRLFEIMGGHFADIPQEYYVNRVIRETTPDTKIATKFSPVMLPPGSRYLFQITTNRDMQDCQRYVLSRGIFFISEAFQWSPKYPRHVIYPFQYYGRIIGWIARKIDPGGHVHLKCEGFPRDYMLNQDRLYNRPICIIQEGTFDAIALQSLCTFGSTISTKQINLLNQAKARGIRVVVLPDLQGVEWRSYWQTASNNGWLISVPDYPYRGNTVTDHIKDAGDSIRRNGLLLTIEAIMDGITDNYTYARTLLEMRSR